MYGRGIQKEEYEYLSRLRILARLNGSAKSNFYERLLCPLQASASLREYFLRSLKRVMNGIICTSHIKRGLSSLFARKQYPATKCLFLRWMIALPSIPCHSSSFFLILHEHVQDITFGRANRLRESFTAIAIWNGRVRVYCKSRFILMSVISTRVLAIPPYSWLSWLHCPRWIRNAASGLLPVPKRQS